MSELAALNPDIAEDKALRTKFVRARNVVSDAFEETIWLSSYATERLGK